MSVSSPAEDLFLVGEPGLERSSRRRPLDTLRRAARLPRTRIGLALVGTVVAIALIGPLLAPHSTTEFVAAPYSQPSATTLLGADNLGRDVLSRFLAGGRSLLLLALLATIVGVGLGTVIGLVAAYFRGVVDDVLMRSSDVMLAIPQIVLVLLLVASGGSAPWLIVLAVGATHVPLVARVIRGAALGIVERDFVLAAEVMGEGRARILFGEILSNLTSPLMVEFGLRLTFSIGTVAAVAFLGFGLQPPTADWGLMINENRLGIVQQPWAVIPPIAAIALLTIGTNLITDGIARAAIGIDRREGR